MEVFVRQVVASGKSHLPVDDGDLPVVAVVEEHVCQGPHGIEHAALDPQGVQLLYKICADETDGAEVIVKDADFHAFLHLFRQDVHDAPEGPGRFNGVVFHEDKALRLPEILKLGFQPVRGVLVVGDRGILP